MSMPSVRCLFLLLFLMSVARQCTRSQPVAFSARIWSEWLALVGNGPVVFDFIVTNLGKAYDPAQGIFTAPSKGGYVFFLSVMTNYEDSDLYLEVVKNGAVLDKVFAKGGESYFDQGSTQVTTELTKGDKVWVRLSEGDGMLGSYWSIFSGFRLA